MACSEIFLTKAFVAPQEWQELIDSVSVFERSLAHWQIIVRIEGGELRYFLKTMSQMPVTLSGAEAFLVQSVKEIALPVNYWAVPMLRRNDDILEAVEFFRLRKMQNLKWIEIDLMNLMGGKSWAKVHYYGERAGRVWRYTATMSAPSKFLAVNLEAARNYFYKKAPKYVEINKVLPILAPNEGNAILRVRGFPYSQEDFHLGLRGFDFAKHTLVLGASGCGKSKLVSKMIEELYRDTELRENTRVVVIDPHAALGNDLAHLGTVVDFDQVKVNLFMSESDDLIAATELLVDLFKSLLAEQANPKNERMLRHAIHLLLAAKALNFESLRKLLVDLEYRNYLVKAMTPKLPFSIVNFFLTDFNDLRTKSYIEAVAPIVSFLDEMETLPAMNDVGAEAKDLGKMVEENFLTIFSLDRTRLGNKIVQTVAGLVMEQMLDLVQGKGMARQTMLVIDEVAVVENPILVRMLSEARKYNLAVVLIGQYFDQFSLELKNSIFTNVINYFVFRISRLEAQTFADNLDFSVPLEKAKDQKGQQSVKVQQLTGLNNRECIVRISSGEKLYPAFKAETMTFVGNGGNA